jgi:hypothetical protein
MNTNTTSQDESQKDSEKKTYIYIDQYGVVHTTDKLYFIKD